MNFMFEWQELEIWFLPQELKIHIFELTCNAFFIREFKQIATAGADTISFPELRSP